jgi:hypothetical protein
MKFTRYKYYSGYQIKKNEMDEACSMDGKRKGALKI